MAASGSVRQKLQVERSSARIGERLARLEERVDQHDECFDKLEPKVEALESMRSWLLGVAAAIGAMGVLLANGIRAWLKA